MEAIGAFDAKTRFSELLERVAKGESFRITRHGHPVARLSPDPPRDTERARRAVARLAPLRGVLRSATIDEISLDKHEGHRF
jgi:prevent-host-death family protein